MTKPVSKWHSPEYFAERQPILDAFNAQILPFWSKVLLGELTNDQYVETIAPFVKQYVRNVTPVWEKHGGPK